MANIREYMKKIRAGRNNQSNSAQRIRGSRVPACVAPSLIPDANESRVPSEAPSFVLFEKRLDESIYAIGKQLQTMPLIIQEELYRKNVVRVKKLRALRTTLENELDELLAQRFK